jgi:hypothetical protein
MAQSDESYATDAAELVVILSECKDNSLHVELDALRNELEAQKTRVRPVRNVHVDAGYIAQTVWGETTNLPFRLPSASVDRRSQKRRHAPTTDSADQYDNEHTLDAADSSNVEPVLIHVNRNTLAFVDKMWPSKDSRDGSGKDVQWVDFRKAPVDMGFEESHGGGSAVQFRCDRGMIVFHKPHPDATYSAIQVRENGKRLTRWFGFEGDEGRSQGRGRRDGGVKAVASRSPTLEMQ